MSDDQSSIESAPTASIKSLKSRFEQLAQESSGVARPLPTPSKPNSAPSLLSPQLYSRHLQDDRSGSSYTSHEPLRTPSPNSDLSPGQKRAPPPPPSRSAKKSTSSPTASPLSRPVPVPTRASPNRFPAPQGLHSSEDGNPRGSGVASLRERFASNVASSHYSAPRPVLRPPYLIANGESNTLDSLSPVPPCAPKPIPQIFPSPPSVLSPEDTLPGESFDPPNGFIDPSPPMVDVTSLKTHFSSLIHQTPHLTSNPPSRDNIASHSEPNLLAPSPPVAVRRHPPPPPPQGHSVLFDNNDNLPDLCSNSSFSRYSPFSDDGSSEESFLHTIPLCASSTSASEHAQSYSDSIGGSNESAKSISPSPKHRPPPRTHLTVPPRPPRRNDNGNGNPHPSRDSLASSIPMLNVPPPLPTRRTIPADTSDVASLPPSLSTCHNMNTPSPTNLTSPGERKLFGAGKLPPPPMRIIAPGEKLPPPRRAHTPSSDEESGPEEPSDDPRVLLPDASRASRRPPTLRAPRVHVPAYAAQVVVAGARALVATHHHLRCFDLSRDGYDSVPIWVADTKEMGVKVTALEFRAGSGSGLVWVGTKEGHLLEVDMNSGEVKGSKFGAHAGVVTHIFRYANAMLSVDESGKVLVFEPIATSGSHVPSLTYTSPRVYRIAEKPEFVKLLGGLLWTSMRGDPNGSTPTSLRIYDVFTPGSVGRTVNVLPNSIHHVGAVTSGTLLQSHIGHAYLGHEGGFISIWNLMAGPECTDVVKVSSSDILSLEGVGTRLWAGGRVGVICAYDVMSRPWVVTNAWNAHTGLPVMRIFVDPWAIEKEERLSVVSIGRDEQIRLWDGLLGVDWIGNELLKRENTFSSFRTISVLVVSWNVDAAKPDSLTDDPANLTFLHDTLTSGSTAPDIISFGFQEVIDLESRKMAAKTVLLGGKKKGEEGKISEKVTSSYKRWHDRLVREVKVLSEGYTVIHTESLVGLFTCMFVKNSERSALKDVAIATIKRGMGGRYGNKGGIVARFVIDDSSICFINCHLAAGQHHVRQRNGDVAAMLEEKSVFPSSDAVESLAYVGGGDGSMVLDHEIVFLNGDLNYRIDQRRDVVISAVQSGDLESLHTYDQLLKEMKYNRGFRLRSFREGPLTFAPTYKYDRRSSAFDSSEKKRVPAWCDRVLWRSRDPERVHQLQYRRYEANVSDHRPVSAVFATTVKSVRLDAWAREKALVEEAWLGTQVELLASAREFYVEQALM